ncbi:NPC intracellular cholesterol transporter 2-like [Crassostrea virginica]|uniref:Epididymal secretory protein E1-like n=1 Tax=Crassostrea virginica TaxID=6565 RepID=A0A8B8E2Z7_CRAVI|nr:epididymal secretory protein E1-like [Crassostrea virginica]
MIHREGRKTEKMKLLVVVVVSVLFSVVSSGPLFKTCDSLNNVKSATVTGCSVAPCTLEKGKNATFKVVFTADKEATQLKAVVHGIIGGVPLPFNPPNVDGCTDSGITCPVGAGKTYTYTNSIPVLKTYPSLRLVVKYELKNEKDQPIFCVMLPAQIK